VSLSFLVVTIYVKHCDDSEVSSFDGFWKVQEGFIFHDFTKISHITLRAMRQEFTCALSGLPVV
jgi:hypothetical protein